MKSLDFTAYEKASMIIVTIYLLITLILWALLSTTTMISAQNYLLLLTVTSLMALATHESRTKRANAQN